MRWQGRRAAQHISEHSLPQQRPKGDNYSYFTFFRDYWSLAPSTSFAFHPFNVNPGVLWFIFRFCCWIAAGVPVIRPPTSWPLTAVAFRRFQEAAKLAASAATFSREAAQANTDAKDASAEASLRAEKSRRLLDAAKQVASQQVHQYIIGDRGSCPRFMHCLECRSCESIWVTKIATRNAFINRSVPLDFPIANQMP